MQPRHVYTIQIQQKCSINDSKFKNKNMSLWHVKGIRILQEKHGTKVNPLHHALLLLLCPMGLRNGDILGFVCNAIFKGNKQTLRRLLNHSTISSGKKKTTYFLSRWQIIIIITITGKTVNKLTVKYSKLDHIIWSGFRE